MDRERIVSRLGAITGQPEPQVAGEVASSRPSVAGEVARTEQEQSAQLYELIRDAEQQAIEAHPSFRRSFPLSKAQRTILDILGANNIENFAQAEVFFENLGISVTSRREGQRSIPEVKELPSIGFNREGEGVQVRESLSPLVRKKLAEWLPQPPGEAPVEKVIAPPAAPPPPSEPPVPPVGEELPGDIPGVPGDRVTASGVDPNVEYEFEYRVVDLDDLIPSHTDALSPNPYYPAELQPRLRERMASRAQITEIATKLNVNALLTDVGWLNSGPMIIGSDMVVESGNGRTLALRMAREQNPEKWREYVQGLTRRASEWGVDPGQIANIENPVLVRQRLSDVNRMVFASEANQPTAMTMSAVENALQDAARISDNSVTALVSAEGEVVEASLLRASNRLIVKEFLDSFTGNERAMLIDTQDGLNQAGLQRLKA